MKILFCLLVFIPVTVIGELVGFNESLMFACSALSIVGLAAIMGKATETAAHYLGQRAGGFLNATLGNLAELLINIFILKAGMIEVVKASIVGSIIGNILLVLGLSILLGGLRRKEQRFNNVAVELDGTMLFFTTIAMCIPAAFIHTMSDSVVIIEELSMVIAGLLLMLYILQIIFSFVTHKDALTAEADDEEEKPSWSLRTSVIILVAVTACLCYVSEVFSGSVQGMSEELGISQGFVGLIMIPVIGNAAEHSTAIVMAVKNKMDAAIEVSVGSTLQVIMFVMPILLFVSLIFKPMDLVFTPFELVALIASALITNRVISDGRSYWIEGAQLLGIYVIIAFAYFMV